MATKSVHEVDGFGEFTGMNILTAGANKLQRVDEKEAFAAAQRSVMRMVELYKKDIAEGNEVEQAEAAIVKFTAVAKGYTEFTGYDPFASTDSA